MIVRLQTLLLIACVAVVRGGLIGRIIGGRDAEDNAYPYQVSLRVHGSHRCGGSLLNHQWILTAAHCLVKYDSNSMTVVLGTNSLLSGGVAYRADYFVIHPDHDRISRVNDIALIKVIGNIEYTKAIAPVALPEKETNESSRELIDAVFTGWGDVETSGATHDELQEIQLNLITLSECRKTFPKVKDTNICTLTMAGQGLCYGDSGSPLVSNGVQIAIASWGSPCALGYPDVHTRVYSFINWIRSYVG